MVVKSRVLRSAANGELHSPVTPEEKPKRSKVATHGKKNAKAAAPGGDAVEPSPSPARRTSARIQIKQLAEKELLVRQRVELLDEPDSDSKKKKKTNSQVKRKRNTPSVKDEVGEGKGELVEDKAGVVPVSNDVTNSKDGDANKPMEVCSPEKSRAGDDVGPANMVEKSDHVKVKETLRLFNKYYLHFVQVRRGETGNVTSLELILKSLHIKVYSHLTFGYCMFI